MSSLLWWDSDTAILYSMYVYYDMKYLQVLKSKHDDHDVLNIVIAKKPFQISGAW